MTYNEVFALRLRETIEERGISLTRLAFLSGLRQSTLQNIYQGNTKNPTLRTMHRVAKGLNMTVSELLNFEQLNEGMIEGE